MTRDDDFNTGAYCSKCGGDSFVCGPCRDAEWRAAVELVRGRVPRGSGAIDASLANLADVTLDSVLAAMVDP